MKEIILIAQISLSFLCALIIIYRKDKNHTEGTISAIWCATMLSLGIYGISSWPEPMSVKIVLSAILSAGLFGLSVKSVLLNKQEIAEQRIPIKNRSRIKSMPR